MKRTHRVVAHPTVPVQYLADYMAASNQARRGIVQKCKYKSLARVLQHQMARKTITDHLLGGNPLPGDLAEKAQALRERLADTDFDASLNQHNGDFVDAFATHCDGFDASAFNLVAATELEPPAFHETVVPFTPSLLTYRKTKANTHKIGAIMFRYAKGKPVPQAVAEWQAAFMYGFFSDRPFIEEAKPEGKLCVVWCAVSGERFTVPDKPIYKFNEMKAVCGDISERWANVPPPPGAII